jgi:hypothetical protein
MRSVSDIFALWPSGAALARDIGRPYQTVQAWKQRGSIPPEYWLRLVEAARRRGHPELTATLLARLHAGRESHGGLSGLAEEEIPFAPPGVPPASGDGGHFSRWKQLRRSNFASRDDVAAHLRALREEWGRR